MEIKRRRKDLIGWCNGKKHTKMKYWAKSMKIGVMEYSGCLMYFRENKK